MKYSNCLKKNIFLLISCIFFSTTILLAQTHQLQFVAKWGKNGGDGNSGTSDGEFSTIGGVATDNQGNIYVTDVANHRIQKFDVNGNFLAKWGKNGGDGSQGTGDGEFIYPYGIVLDNQGNIYITETGNNRIQKFDANMNFLTKWGKGGEGNGEFNEPIGMALDKQGNIYVAGGLNYRIQKFDSKGSFLAKWGKYGVGDGEFVIPSRITLDNQGNIYVADTYNNRIQKFDSNGNFLAKWGKNGGDGSHGKGDGEFRKPEGITLDNQGNIYVADTYNNRIQKFDSNGNFLAKWGKNGGDGSHGKGDGEFSKPFDITLDNKGNMYVADTDNHRIQKFIVNNPPASLPIAGKTFYIKNTYGGASHPLYGTMLSWNKPSSGHPMAVLSKSNPTKWEFQAVPGKPNTYKIVSTTLGQWQGASISWDGHNPHPLISVEFNDPVEWRMDAVPGKPNTYKIVSTYAGQWQGASISWDNTPPDPRASLEFNDPVEWELILVK